MNEPVNCPVCELPHSYPHVHFADFTLYGVSLSLPMQSYECQYCGSETITQGTDKINIFLAKTFQDYLHLLHTEGIIG